MRLQRHGTARKWARAALKCGFLLTDTKLWTSIGKQLRDQAVDVDDEVKRRYEDTADRLHDAGNALQGRRRHWPTRPASFIGGIGIGVGLGMLWAPVSGKEARSVLRGRVVEIRDKVSDMAAGVTGIRSSGMDSATGASGN